MPWSLTPRLSTLTWRASHIRLGRASMVASCAVHSSTSGSRSVRCSFRSCQFTIFFVLYVGAKCRACLSRHLYALLHPQKSLGSLSFGDPSELLRPIFKYLRASSQDCTNREATDRQQAGRNHTTHANRTPTHTRAAKRSQTSQVVFNNKEQTR